MKIAILGSVALPVPPPAQGGTEWIAYFQAKGLADLGHKVILFAARGSRREEGYELVEVGGGDTIKKFPISNFKFQNSNEISEKKDENTEASRLLRKENVYLAEVIEQLIGRKDDFDIVLNNMRGEAVLLPVAKYLHKPFVNVMHLPLFPELAGAFRRYNTHVITISNAQRKGFEGLNYLATVYNCVDTGRYIPNSKTISNGQNSKNQTLSNLDLEIDLKLEIGNLKLNAGYLLMMGTIGRHKNQAGAISIAKKAGMQLILAGKIRDKDYFEELKKEIDGESVKYFGELSFEDKLKLYRNAKAFIFPILWEEPFGLVMIEAMACGTPVVAYNNGAIPEVVVSGKTGFVVESGSEEDMVSAVKNIGLIDREDCRNYVEENFSIDKIIKDYEKALMSSGI